MNSKKQLDAIEVLNDSASLVENLGKCKLENGKTLVELLTIDGISFWDIFTSELAQTHFPLVLASDINTKKKYINLRLIYSRIKIYIKNEISKYSFREKLKPNINKDIILCLGFTNQSYRDIMTAIVSKLSFNTSYSVIVISDRNLPTIINTIPNNCTSIINWQFYNQTNLKLTNEIKNKLKKVERYLEINNFLDQLIPENKKYFNKEFKILFKRLFYIHLNNIVPHAVISRHILKEFKPKIIITPDSSDPRARSFTTQASYFNIPTLSVQFGLVGIEAVEWRFLSTNIVAVWGEASRRSMLNQNVSEKRIQITGSPRYDYIYNHNNKLRINKSIFRIKKKQCVVLLASSYGEKSLSNLSLPNTLDIMKRDIFDVINELPDSILIVKPHPSEDIEYTKKLIKNFENIQIVDKKFDIRELINICDIFISFGSTATTDALVANKISICPVYPGWSFSDIFKNSGATLNPTNKEELFDLLNKLINRNLDDAFVKKLDVCKNRFLEDQIYRNDYKSSERIVSLVLSMIKDYGLLYSKF